MARHLTAHFFWFTAGYALLGAAAQAKPTELLCSETQRPERRWNLTLNEETGTGSLVFSADGEVMAANVPVAFTPEEASLSYGRSKVVVNRTTLALRRFYMGFENPEYAAQCEIVVNPERKF